MAPTSSSIHGSCPLEIVHEICNFGRLAFGREYLEQIVVRASRVLDMRFALIAAPGAEDPSMLESLAFAEHGRLREPLSYPLAGSPCENVLLRQRPFLCERGLAERFPALAMLRRINAVSYMGAPMLDSAGNTMGLFVLMDDRPISQPDRLSAIAEFLAARSAMELVRERDDQRRERGAREERRKDKLQSLGRLAGGVAHEFNNVLSTILGHAEMIEMKAGKDPELRQHAETLIESVSRAGESPPGCWISCAPVPAALMARGTARPMR